MKRPTLLAPLLLMTSYTVITYLPFQGPPCDIPAASLQFLVWRLLCAAVVTLAMLIGLVLWNWTYELWKEVGEQFGIGMVVCAGIEMAAVVVFGAFLFNRTVVFTFQNPWQPELPQAVMGGLILICFALIALPCSVWMTMSLGAFSRLTEGARPLDAAGAFRQMRERAQWVGTLCAVGIAASTLPLGAWRRLVLVADKGLAASFPPEFVVIFRLYWSFFLAAGYLPVYLAVKKTGQAIRDAIPPEDLIKFSGWQKQRLEIDEYLGLGGNAIDHFKIVFAVLAPLLGAVLSIMIGSGDKG